MRVLLVDDEVGILRSLERLFVRRGHQVRSATNGRLALDAAEEFAPDVVISDFKMEGISGAELLRIMAQRFPNTRRVLLSGYAEIDGEIDAVFVHKPYKVVELLRACE
jgi:DNA-binding NtrC family response regulator